MQVFISWSGAVSQSVAVALRDWLPQVIQALEPWISQDMEKGVPWAREIAERLDSTSFGIVCVTPSNMTAPWLTFEAGSLSKPLETARVATVLHGLESGDVKPPLGIFQHTKTTDEADMRRLVGDINLALGDRCLANSLLDQAFQRCWPELNAKLEAISIDAEDGVNSPVRSEADMLAELLDIARSLDRRSAPPEGAPTQEGAAPKAGTPPVSSRPDDVYPWVDPQVIAGAQASRFLGEIAAANAERQKKLAEQIMAPFAERQRKLAEQIMAPFAERQRKLAEQIMAPFAERQRKLAEQLMTPFRLHYGLEPTSQRDQAAPEGEGTGEDDDSEGSTDDGEDK